MRPYTHIGDDATASSAFLCNCLGGDVVTLHRVYPDELHEPDHKEQCLNDKEWQLAINLVDAAPEMADVLGEILEVVSSPPLGITSDEYYDRLSVALQKAKVVLSKLDQTYE